MSGPIRRFLEWRRDLLTPENVEKASSRERMKRGIWMVVSVVVAWSIAVTVVGVGIVTFNPPDWLALAAAFVLWVYLEIHIHRWGVRYFDITPPWQFRDVENGVSD